MSLPLVSCLMVTWNRPLWVPMSVQCFLDQTYPETELVIIDDGDSIRHLLPEAALASGKIHYIHCSQRLLVGVKHNLSHHAAKGEILTPWADDDWHHPEFLAHQVDALLAGPHLDTVAVARVPYVHFITGERVLFDKPGQALDGTYLYWRRVFDERKPFPRTNSAESAGFYGGLEPGLIDAPHLYLGTLHNTNVLMNSVARTFWTPDVNPAPLPPAIQALIADPRLSGKIVTHEVVFKFQAWEGADMVWVAEPEQRQLDEIIRRLLCQAPFQAFDFAGPVPLVVYFFHCAYRVLDATGAHAPYTLVFNRSDVEAA